MISVANATEAFTLLKGRSSSQAMERGPGHPFRTLNYDHTHVSR